MALTSSESMTLIVNGTLQSEFLTMFCPTRLTYSVITGSVMNLVLFSISVAYPLPILISESVEYQLPIPRPPMSRFPTALTSWMLPGLTLIFSLPTSTTFAGSTFAAATSPDTGSVPAGHGGGVLFLFLECLSFLVVVSAGTQSAEADPLCWSFESVDACGGVSPVTG